MELIFLLIGLIIGLVISLIIAIVFLRRSSKIDVRNQFVSMASHQLRTPLTSIKGYISMILDGDTGEINDQQRMFLTEAFESSERMVRMIADFLDVSRIDQGRFELDLTRQDLEKVLRHEVLNQEKTAVVHDLKINLNISQADWLILADFDKLQQVMSNLIDNAIYYSRAGGEINVSLKKTGRKIIFTVQDQGIGVPKDQQKKLFSKFYRAGNAQKARPDGNGIGLYLAQKIVQAHGGKIIFNSTEGQGSLFGFSIPQK